MEQKPDLNQSGEANNASRITANDAAFETEKGMDVPKMNQSKCKCWHALLGILLGAVVAAAIALPLTLGWSKLESFDDVLRFHLCAEGKCLTVKVDVEGRTLNEVYMGEYKDEVVMDEGFDFFEVGSDKNKKGYMAQSFYQEPLIVRGIETDYTNIYHHAIAFGGDQKISICDMVEQTLPATLPLEVRDLIQCQLQVDLKAGTIKYVKVDGTVTYLAVKDDDEDDRRRLQDGKGKDTLVFQTEEYDGWSFFDARKNQDLKEYIQTAWTKNNGADLAAKKTPYADQEGGFVLCGVFNTNHKYGFDNLCGTLQGNCEDDDDCKSGLTCLPQSELKDVVIPKFHDVGNKYCQVKDCAKYIQDTEAVMTCEKCNRGFELKDQTCTKK